jgi:hypothetical protein
VVYWKGVKESEKVVGVSKTCEREFNRECDKGLMWQALEKVEKIFEDSTISLYIIE